MRTAFVAAMCLVLSLWSAPGYAQSRNDLGLLGGWTKPSAEGSVLQFNFGTTYEVSFARRIWASDRIDVAIEVPFGSMGVLPMGKLTSFHLDQLAEQSS